MIGHLFLLLVAVGVHNAFGFLSPFVTIVVGVPHDHVASDPLILFDGLSQVFRTNDNIVIDYARRGPWTSVGLRLTESMSLDDVEEAISAYHSCVEAELNHLSAEELETNGYDCLHVAPFPIDFSPGPHFHLAQKIFEDELVSPSRRLFADNEDAPALERAGLEQLYSYLGGAEWTVQTGWNNASVSVCDWFGVTCDVVPVEDGGDGAVHVVEVRLPKNGLTLSGADTSSNRRHLMSTFGHHVARANDYLHRARVVNGLPLGMSEVDVSDPLDIYTRSRHRAAVLRDSELEHESRLLTRRLFAADAPFVSEEIVTSLPYLRLLDLSINDLTGAVFPENIGDWTRMESLGVFYSGLTGTLPQSFTNMPLKHFLFGISEGYCYDGFFPPGTPCDTPFEHMVGVRTFAEMSYASEGYGGLLEGDLQPFADIPTMEVLWLLGGFSGQGFLEDFCAWENIRGIDLHNMDITGSIPDCFGDMITLRDFTTTGTLFDGSIPSSVGNLVNLVNLQLSKTLLEGTIPASIGEIPQILQLAITESRISGPLPERVCTMPFTVAVMLFENSLSGDLSSECQFFAGAIGGPAFIVLSGNELTGSFADWDFDKWTNIAAFLIDGNQFSGSLPEMANTPMTMAHFSDNNFRGELTSAVLPPGIQQVYLEHLADVSGEFPDFLDTYTSATTWIMSGLDIHGDIHESICSMTSMQTLRLNDMELTGTLPDCLGDLQTLSNLEISQSNITGDIPSALGTIPTLQYLTVRASQLTASALPASFVEHPSIAEIDLSFNNMAGEINSYLIALNLCPNIFSLDLSHNDLQSPISPIHFVNINGVQRFSSLYSFKVNNNRITATLPFNMASLPSIAIVDVSNNLLSGAIPAGFGALPVFRARNNMFGCDDSVDGYDPGACTEMLPVSMVLTGTFLDTGNGFSCPELTSATSSSSIIEIDPQYYNNTLCRCDPGKFGEYGFCTDCLSGGFCPGGGFKAYAEDGDVVTVPVGESLENKYVVMSEIYADQGYYPSPDFSSPTVMIRCERESIDEERCNPGQEEFECRSGYSGRLCGSCINGYYRQGTACQECPADNAVTITMFASFLLLIVAFFALIIQHKRLMRLDDAMKAFLFYVQTFVVISEKAGFIWPESMLKLNNIMKYGSVSISSFSCLGDGDPPSAIDSYVITVTQPLMVFVLVMFYAAIGAAFKMTLGLPRNEIRLHVVRSVHALLFGINVIYLPVTVAVMEVFICTKDEGDGKKYMQFNPVVECDEDGDWGKMRNISIVMMLLHVLFFPLLFAFLLVRYRDRLFTDETIIGLLRFLYSPYKRQYYWYELTTLVRRFILGIFATMLGSDSMMTPFLLSLVVLTSAVVHSYLRPFNTFVLNTLESLVHLALGLTFICGSTFTNYADDSGQGAERTVLEVFVFFLNIGVMLLFILLAVRIMLFPRRKFFFRWAEQELHPGETLDGVADGTDEGVGSEVRGAFLSGSPKAGDGSHSIAKTSSPGSSSSFHSAGEKSIRQASLSLETAISVAI
eukprot:Rmarinus@m.18087